MTSLTSFAKLAKLLGAGRGRCIVLALMITAGLGVQAGTKLWYRFDEKPAGYVTSGSDTFPNAVNPEAYPGEPCTVAGGLGTWEATTTSAMPVYGDGFTDDYHILDPLTDSVLPNAGSVFLGNATTNVYARSGAVVVPDSPALYGDAFTIEFFVRGFSNPDPWEKFFARVDTNGKCTMQLYAFRTTIVGSCYFVTNGVTTSAAIDSVNIGNSMNNRKWRHVAITVDQVRFVVKVYLDYSLLRTVSLPGPLDLSGDGYLVLGKGTDNYGYFQGEFDEFRVSEGTLTPEHFLHIHPTDDRRVSYVNYFSPSDDLFSSFKAVPSPAPYVMTNAPASFAEICEWSDEASRTNEFVGLIQSAEVGANAALSIPLKDPHILTNGDFTIEFFVRVPSGGTKSESYLINLNGGVRARFQNGSSSLSVMKDWSGQYSILLADDNWHHVAWVVKRSTGSVSFYFDYALYGGIAYTMPSLAANAKVHIGSYDGSALKFNTLWLDDVRITKAALDENTFLRPRKRAVIETCRVPFTRSLGDFLSYGYGFNGRSVVRPSPWGTLSLDETNRPSAMIYEGRLDGKGYTNTVSAGFVGNSNGASGFYKVPDDKTNPMADGSFTAEMFVCCGTDGGWGLNMGNQCFLGQSNAFRVEFWQGLNEVAGIDSSGSSFAHKAIELKRWYHVAYVQDVEKDELRLYVDRKLVGTKQGIPARNGDLGDFIYLMANPKQDYVGSFAKAWADEARFTRRALTPDEFLRPHPEGYFCIIFR